MYIVLSGRPPFSDEALNKLGSGVKWSFPSKYWSSVSLDAKDLVRQLLCPDASKRISAQDCLDHQWFDGVTAVERGEVKTQLKDSAESAESKKRSREEADLP